MVREKTTHAHGAELFDEWWGRGKGKGKARIQVHGGEGKDHEKEERIRSRRIVCKAMTWGKSGRGVDD